LLFNEKVVKNSSSLLCSLKLHFWHGGTVAPSRVIEIRLLYFVYGGQKVSRHCSYDRRWRVKNSVHSCVQKLSYV